MGSTVSIMFSRAELAKLHRQFYHPPAEKLFELLNRTRPDDTTPKTLEVLKGLSRQCDPCQRIQNAPKRFKVSFGAVNARLNESYD